MHSPRPTGEPSSRDQIWAVVIRIPGYSATLIANRIGLKYDTVQSMLQVMRDKGEVECRRVTDDDHVNYGKFGWFPRVRNPL